MKKDNYDPTSKGEVHDENLANDCIVVPHGLDCRDPDQADPYARAPDQPGTLFDHEINRKALRVVK